MARSFSFSEEKRRLRSQHGGSKFKSELSIYFPRYNQLLSLNPVKTEYLSIETTIVLICNIETTNTSATQVENGRSSKPLTKKPFLDLHQAQVIEDLGSHLPREESRINDPLTNSVYFKSHRRIERKETQLRNIEKERAQHEKLQLDSLLGSLQGADWPRIIGIGNISESEKRLYEPRRVYFISEVIALLEKFRMWKEKEKIRKAERELSVANKTGNISQNKATEVRECQPISDNDPFGRMDLINGDSMGNSPSETDDIDIWAAHQLHQEAMSALPDTHSASVFNEAVPVTSANEPLSKSIAASQLQGQTHLGIFDEGCRPCFEAASLSKGAFGQLLPDIPLQTFGLSPDILTEAAVRDCLRRNRRRKRKRKM